MKELLNCMLISQATLLVSVHLASEFFIILILFELTVVINTKHHFSAASHSKQDCYGPLLQDLQDCFIC